MENLGGSFFSLLGAFPLLGALEEIGHLEPKLLFLVTVVAVEWFLFNLNSVMHSRVIILAEFFITVVEVEWFFTM